MRGPCHRRRLGVAVFLVLSALASPFFSSVATAYGERVYESNTVVPIGDPYFLVYSGQSVAQSFTPSVTHILLNVTLRLRDLDSGSNPVNITIRPDSGGVPSTSVLAWANRDAPGSVGPVNVPLTPTPTLTQGVQYWIVAAKSGDVTNAYEWHHSDGNTYAGGKAMTDGGSGWTNPFIATDMWFRNFGRELEANVTVAMTASTTQAQPKDTLFFTVYLNNTGTRAAQTVWLDDTLPAGFTYLSDTADSIPATTGYPNYTFANLGNGAHSFTITVRVRIDVAPGTPLTNVVALAYTNSTGAPRPPGGAQATVVVGLQWKQLYLVPGNPGPPHALVPKPPTGPQVNYRLSRGGAAIDFQLATDLSRSLRIWNVTPVLYLNSNSNGVRNLDMNFTLLDVVGATQTPIWYGQRRVVTDSSSGYERFSFPFPATDLNVTSGHQVLLRIKCLGSSNDDAWLATNATLKQSKVNLLTSTYVQVDSLQLRDGNGPATVWSSLDRLVTWVNVSDPFGAVEIAGAWINITDPSGALVRNFTAMSLLSSGTGWKLFDTSLGSPLANGTYGIEVVAKEANGAFAYGTATAVVRSPDVRPAIVPTRPSALSGDTFAYTVWFNNTGTGPASRVWINLTLASQLVFVTSSAEANRTGPTNWTWTNVEVGSPSFAVEVRVRSGIPPAPSMASTLFLNSTDEKHYLWPARSASASVVLQGPVLSFAFTSSRPTIHSNEVFDLSATLRNTGDHLAGTVWLNLTWSPELTYVSDTAASVGGTSSERINGRVIQWTNLTNGPPFTVIVTVRTGPELPRGLQLTTLASLAYTNARGAIMPDQSADQSVAVIAPSIVNATIWLGQTAVTPGDVVPGRIGFENIGDEAALSLVITLSLDPSLAVRNASVTPTISGTAALFVLANVELGARWIFLNLTVSRMASDRAVLSVLGSVVYTDRVANPMAPVSANPASVTVAAPVLRLGGSPSSMTVEAGTAVTYRIDASNLGSGTAEGVWLNATLPLDLLYLSDSSDGERTRSGPRITWHWPSFGQGSRTFNVTLALRSGAADGDSEDVALEANYADSNGNVRSAPGVVLRASVIAPQLQLTLETSAEAVRPQTLFQYTLRVRNVGTSIARTIWIMDSLDDGLKVVSYSSEVPAAGTRDLNWTYQNLQPDEEEVIRLNVQVEAGVPAGTTVPNFITAVFTNSQGQVIGAAQSNAVVVTVGEASSPLPYIGAAFAGVGAVVGFVVYRRRTSRIEEVFLITKEGILIDHLARNLVHDKDPDIVSGMLTGIQKFVQEAFKFGEGGDLNQMEFGDHHVLIERGKHVYVAAVTSGGDPQAVAAKLKKSLDLIETEFGDVLEKFDGSMDQILGVRERLRERLLG
jgi:uncharacterized repeat protein (TIGR01451 family)